MELVTGVFATMAAGVGGTAAAGTAAVAGHALYGGAVAASTASTLLTTAQILGTAFTALSTIGAGNAALTAAKGEANMEAFQANDAKITADLEAAEIKKKLALTMQRNKVAAAAGGVDLGSVSVQQAQKQVAQDAEQSLGMVNLNKQRSLLASHSRVRGILQAGKTRLATSLLEAGGVVANGAFEVLNRG